MKRRLQFAFIVFVPVHFSAAVAEITVISVYEGQSKFLQAAQAAESPDLDALARQYLVAPYLDDCSKGLSPEDRKDNEEALATPFSEMEELAAILHELEQNRAAAIVEQALDKASMLLPTNSEVTVCLEGWDPGRMPDKSVVQALTSGVAGQFYGAGIIWIAVYPFPGWQDQVKFTAPHEYHHLVRDVGEDTNLIDVLVREGLADLFASEVHDDWEPDSYVKSEFTSDVERQLWAEFEPNLLSTDEDTMKRYLFGSVYGAEDLPPAVGYTFGRYIAKAYRKNAPDVAVPVWTQLPADEIFRISGYDGDSGPTKDALHE